MVENELMNLYKSENISDILQFYRHFDNVSDLIGWMQGIPKSKPNIKIIEGENSDIAVLCPRLMLKAG